MLYLIIIRIICAVSIIITLSGCSVYESLVYPKRTIYNFPENRFWAHRINNPEQAKEVLAHCNGIETDVFYVEEERQFKTGHDKPSDLSLDDFFKNINNAHRYYYWIDFKNLSEPIAAEAAAEMKRIVQKYHLEKKVIVESKKVDLLTHFHTQDIFTSYWVDNKKIIMHLLARNKLAKKIKEQLEQYHPDVLSGSHRMNWFFQRHFKTYNIHLWSTSVSKKAVLNNIYKISSFNNVKIILVDYNTVSPDTLDVYFDIK